MEGRDKDVRKEIESHSSALTNERIAEIKTAVWKIGYEVSSSRPTPINRLRFFNIIMEYYLETKDAYGDRATEIIHKMIKEGNGIASRMRITGHPVHMERLLQICYGLQHMINTALQEKRYFFRIGRPDPKGLDQALEIFGGRESTKEDGKDKRVSGPVGE